MNYIGLLPRQKLNADLWGRGAEMLLLFAASVASGLLKLYIPQFSISLSLRSIPIFLVGFLFGPWAGILNGAAADLISFPWGGNLVYSPLFLIQTAAIGLVGGLGRGFLLWDWRRLDACMAAMVSSASLFFGWMFPSEANFLIMYALILGGLWIWARATNSRLSASLVLCSGLLIYWISFGLGAAGSALGVGWNSPLLFFRVRIWKELTRVLVFLPLCRLYLNNSREIHR